jgi:hypothetical protein
MTLDWIGKKSDDNVGWNPTYEFQH